MSIDEVRYWPSVAAYRDEMLRDLPGVAPGALIDWLLGMLPEAAVDCIEAASDEQLATLTRHDLLPLLQSRDPSVREAAIRALPKVHPAS